MTRLAVMIVAFPVAWWVAHSVFGLSYDHYVTRDCCGMWPRWALHLYATSHVVPPEPTTHEDRATVWRCFERFILACGLGHTEGYLFFAAPSYEFMAAWHALTAVVSWWAVLAIFRLRAYILSVI